LNICTQGHAVTVVTQTTDHYPADSKMAETEGTIPLVPEVAEVS
jgi:hypothetical protein